MLSTLSSDRASALDSPVLEVQAMTLEQQVIALEKQLREQASAFCKAHAEAVQRTNDLRILYDAAVRNGTEAHTILISEMMGRDPERRQLMRVLERLQRIVRGKL
jgi:hypothetical protein